MSQFDADRDAVLARASEAGVRRILCIGSGDWQAGSNQRASRLAEACDLVDASVGIHPHDAACFGPEAEAQLLTFLEGPKIVGWGEIGLDYYYLHADAPTQIRAFARQLDLAYERRLPVIIHSRSAEADTVAALKQARRLPLAGVMHCFGGTWETAEACLELGFFISFAGNVTFRNAAPLQEVARRVPLDRLLVETDSPFLAPVPLRGQRNEPANVAHVARFLAQLRGEDCAVLEEAASSNYFRLFGEP